MQIKMLIELEIEKIEFITHIIFYNNKGNKILLKNWRFKPISVYS